MSSELAERVTRAESLRRTMSVLIADDHPLMLAGIRRTLEHAEDIDVVGEAQSCSQLLLLIERRAPDVVLMDMHMPDMVGMECIEEIREQSPHVKIVVLSASDEPRSINGALEAGASAYVVKSAAASDVVAVLRQVINGAVFVASTGPLRGSRNGSLSDPCLTDREQSVLGLAAAGLTTTQISQELWLSEHTIKFHLTKVYRKLGVANRAAAVRYAIEAGIGRPKQSRQPDSP
jgi:DNA-binding NarL/FixJ family response regulator